MPGVIIAIIGAVATIFLIGSPGLPGAVVVGLLWGLLGCVINVYLED